LTARWHVLTARVPDALDDEIAAVLGSGSLGVEVAASGPGMSVLRVYLSSVAEAARWRDLAETVLSAHGLAAPEAEIAIAPVTDEAWVERWQASLAPIPLGSRFIVVPTATGAEIEGRETIRLIPGMAFGTGEHETTRLAAAVLEREVRPGSRWLDLGTGTGLLAIVAARCGAASVVAVDIDPEAVGVASEVVRANHAAAVVDVRPGSIAGVSGGPFDGIVANIQTSFFLAETESVAAALCAGGVLVATGILDDDVREVAAAFTAARLRIEAKSIDGAWACLLARRVGA
jgi:ribosomal protein L11 methyltransferase